MIRAAIRGAGYDNLKRALRDRLPFRTSGALSGDTYTHGTGWLSNVDDLKRYDADRERIVYAVYSYETPIAWVTEDGEVYKVVQRFSVTTSKHQGTLYNL